MGKPGRSKPSPPEKRGSDAPVAVQQHTISIVLTMKPKARGAVVPALFFVVLGILNALNEKLLYEQESQGLDVYGVHKFVKPFFFSTVLSSGCVFSLLTYFVFSWMGREGYQTAESSEKFRIWEFALPGFFGLFQSAMSSVTIAVLGVSIDYMMRSATLVGVALIARFWFGQQFHTYESVGVVLVVVSLILVGIASVMNAGNSSTVLVSKGWAVVVLVLKTISQLSYSVKLSVEQFFTQQKRIHPAFVTGCESAWGFGIAVCLMLPIAHFMPGQEGNGVHEDLLDTIEQLRHNSMIIILIMTSLCIESIYQVSSVALTSASSAIVRTLVESFRNFLIWVVQLCLFYGLAQSETLGKYKGLGEEWSKGSWIQLFGYVVLIIGLLTYGGTFSRSRWKRYMFQPLETQIFVRE